MNEPVLARLQHLMTLREEVESLAGVGPWTPAADWCDGDTHLELHLDVPGVQPGSLELLEEGDTVTVAGQRPEGTRLLHTERPSGTFRRTFTFPEPVMAQSGQATLSGGVLVVKFEKRHPTINVPVRGED
ncbi:Hsp20/alpha crystallin family protein [Deinococcus actinosclerus]|uniref:Heat-shock protein n=1 Tax=Deinococcus actinosclerus TaxID=1768108 RepID=A0ABN4K704_9DEIO|nr:Hsp20/alpha crystallin family protein [Deinococcus actinosclerus]ALW88724.1 heat-shock protein [Deinococcus actinosclerus]